MLHTTTLYEEMIHVPLVIRSPPRFSCLPARWSGIVELRDVVPTLCDVLRLTYQVGTDRSFLRLLRSEPAKPRTARAWTSDECAIALAAVVTDRRKLVMDRRAHRLAVYHMVQDPREEHDPSAARPTCPASRAEAARPRRAAGPRDRCIRRGR